MEEDPKSQVTEKDVKGAPPPLPTPEYIGPYKIEGLLNHGGMSYIYLAKHPTTGETVVVKVVRNKYLKDKEMLTRLLNEAKVLGLTTHPGIVKLYDLGQWEKGLFVAMEFIQGVSLHQFIRENMISHKRALEIILQISYALAHLHSHGVIHRDLKPDNVMILESGDIKLIDFGIAQFLLAPENERITKGKARMGTPNYMSPEQRENADKVSYGSDIFSLGIIAYELYLGRLCHGVLRMDLLPKSFRAIIEKALKINPDERYTDIVDFISDMSQYLKTVEEGEEEVISDQMYHLIQNTHTLLLSKTSPHWPSIEIGIAVKEGSSLSSLYLDFFSLDANRYGILLAEPIEKGIDSLTHTAVLRGMSRMAVKIPDPHPVKILDLLNRALCDDPMKQPFRLAFLLLDTAKDLLSFASSEAGSLLHFREQNPEARVLSTPNPPVGAGAALNFLESEDRWEQGSTLIFPSFAAQAHTGLGEDLLLAPQPLADKTLGKLLAGQRPVRTAALLAIVRI